MYFDLDFLTQLQDQFGAIGDLAAQYIVAHEYGHHVQNVLGVSSEVSRLQQQNPDQANAYSVALELQADCFAGAWAKNAEQRGQLEPGEISEALNAAAAVGDDRIQQQAGQQVNPDSFTHGTSEQRVSWFRRGLRHRRPPPVQHVRRRCSRRRQPPRRRYSHSAGPMPKRRCHQLATAMATIQYAGGEHERGVEPGRADPAQPVDDEVEDEGVGDVQRQAHRAGVAQQLDGRRAGEAVGQPRDRRRTRRGPCRARWPCTRSPRLNGSLLASTGARAPTVTAPAIAVAIPNMRQAEPDRRRSPPVGLQHPPEHDAGAEERQPRQQRVGAVDGDVEQQRPR